LPYITGISWCDEQLTADGRGLNISLSLQTCFLEQSSKFVLQAVSLLLTTLEAQNQQARLCSGVNEDSILLEYDAVLFG
jgi:hypothetical protein